MSLIKKVAVIGAGSWGTALAIHIAAACPEVVLWAHRPEHVLSMQQQCENAQYLPNVVFPETLRAEVSLSAALLGAEVVLVSVPSKAFAETLALIKTCLDAFPDQQIPIIYATKGLEHGTGHFLHTVIQRQFSSLIDYPHAIISGPSFAKEVAMGLPTAVVIAANHIDVANYCRPLFHHNGFRIYTSTDVIGVEVGGAYKNVIAIAAGISDGLGFGANARAALITRGLAEMQRLGVAVGGKLETFMGLAGLGDLLLTATDNQSRNRRFGMALGQGVNPKVAEYEIGQVVEGATTAIEILRLAANYGIELPIVTQVHNVIYAEVTAKEAVLNLLKREAKQEI